MRCARLRDAGRVHAAGRHGRSGFACRRRLAGGTRRGETMRIVPIAPTANVAHGAPFPPAHAR
ncbi:hypothetical protein WM24_17600 [Burkholderia ubonensis]|nr:hypothetical protein WM24_17600 [Burkholderia ubonensis]